MTDTKRRLVNRLLRRLGYCELWPSEMELAVRLDDAGCGEYYIAGVIRNVRRNKL